MADEKSTNMEEALEALNKRNRNMMIGVILVALLGLGGTGGSLAYFMVFKEQAAVAATEEGEHDKAEEEEEDHSGPPEDKTMLGPIFAIDELMINLDTREGARFLKVTIVLEADEEETLEELTKRLPQLQDIAISLISSKDPIDLQGSDGKYRLREELRYRYNRVLLNGSVPRVYFTKFVIQ